MNDNDAALVQLKRLATANTTTISILGARTMVLGKFLDAVLPQLKTEQRTVIAQSFQQSIEDVMSMMDDVPLPADYHSALLEMTNVVLAALASRSSTHGQH